MYLLVGMGGGLERKLFDTPPPAHCIMLSDEQGGEVLYVLAGRYGGGLERKLFDTPPPCSLHHVIR